MPLRSLRLAEGAANIVLASVVNSIDSIASIAGIVVVVVCAVVTIMGRRIVNHLCSLICKCELMLPVPRTRVSTTSGGCASSTCSGSSISTTTSGGCASSTYSGSSVSGSTSGGRASSTYSGSSVSSSTSRGSGLLASNDARRPGWKFHRGAKEKCPVRCTARAVCQASRQP